MQLCLSEYAVKNFVFDVEGQLRFISVLLIVVLQSAVMIIICIWKYTTTMLLNSCSFMCF